ncbi:MAG: hypothetical protein JNK72_03380, partial [Myxococcales bacterium]|nr:hypothetical protein [Myxococcales bacterium]
AALDCASVNRVKTRDESNNPLSAADRVLLPPLEVLASGGNYRLHNQVTVQRGAMSDAWGGRNPKVVVRGTAFQGGGSPSTFTFDRALPSPPDMPAGVAPPEPVDLLRIEGGVDLDLRNIEFKSTQRPNACVTSPP